MKIFFSADHDDQEIVMYNRAMLPAYYGLLRMMCQQSRVFTRNLSLHQNLQWAFKNITPHPTQYPQVFISCTLQFLSCVQLNIVGGRGIVQIDAADGHETS